MFYPWWAVVGFLMLGFFLGYITGRVKSTKHLDRFLVILNHIHYYTLEAHRRQGGTQKEFIPEDDT